MPCRAVPHSNHALWWVHAERLLQTLMPKTPEQTHKLDKVRNQIWGFYRDLKLWTQMPSARDGPVLAYALTSGKCRPSPSSMVRPTWSLPLLECCRGVRQTQAAKSRPLEKVSIGGAKVAIAAAVTAPRIVVSRRIVSSEVARLRHSASRPAIFSARPAIWSSRRRARSRRAAGNRRLSPSMNASRHRHAQRRWAPRDPARQDGHTGH